MGAIVGAIGDDEFTDPAFGQVSRGQFDGLTGSNQDGGLLAEILENPLGKADRRERHGNGTVADGGVGPDLLGGGKGMLKKFSKGLSDGAGFGRGLVSRFHLPENLRFAENHRIEPGSDAKHVAYRGRIGMGVEIALKIFSIDPLFVSDPIDQRLR